METLNLLSLLSTQPSAMFKHESSGNCQPPKKQRKMMETDRKTFRISCKLAGTPKHKLNVQVNNARCY